MEKLDEKKLVKEQEIPMFQLNDAVNQLIAISKKEKETLDHEIVLAKSRLAEIKTNNIKLQSEFSQWKISEEQKFKNDLSKRHNQLIDQENKMNLLLKDLEQRRADLLVKEERYLSVEKDRREIGNSRVEIEKMRTNAINLMSEADRRLSEAKSVIAQSNSKIEEAKKLDDKNNIRNQEFSSREDKINFELKNLDMERNHLIELKEFVEPKIREIKEIEDNINSARKEVEIKHQEVINKEEENKIALKAMEDKKDKLDRQEKEIRSKEDELKRNLLLLDSRKP